MAITYCVLAFILLDAEDGGAWFPPDERSRLPYTVDQAAALMVSQYELILEANVMSVEPLQIQHSMGHQWVSEIWIQPTRQLWGQVEDPSLRVITESVSPEQEASLPPYSGGVMHMPYESPPPKVGERGVFLLSTPYEIVPGVPSLWSTRCCYLPMLPDDSTRVCILDLSYGWLYEEVVGAIRRNVEEQSLESLAPQADAIFVGRLGDPHSWRLDVERTYRGRVDDPFFLALPFDSKGSDPELVVRGILARRLGSWMDQRAGGRVLVLVMKREGAWQPVGRGTFYVAGNQLRMQRRVKDGKLGWVQVALEDLEPILSGRPNRALPAPKP